MVTNIAAYHFAPIAAPDEFAATLHARAEAHALRGSVLVAGEGLNLFLAGDNLSDKHYREAFSRLDAPGINFTLGAEWDF